MTQQPLENGRNVLNPRVKWKLHHSLWACLDTRSCRILCLLHTAALFTLQYLKTFHYLLCSSKY